MQTIQFKTNLKCNGCVQTIKPGLESIKGIVSWKVFVDNPNKTLEIRFKDIAKEDLSEQVIRSISNKGYTIQEI